MVWILVKNTLNARDEFLFQTEVSISIGELTPALVRIHNLRTRLQSQGSACYNLANEQMSGRPEEHIQRLMELHREAKYHLDSSRVERRDACTEEEIIAVIAKIEAAAREIFPDFCKDSPASAIPAEEELEKLTYDEIMALATRLMEAGVRQVEEDLNGLDDADSARKTLGKLRVPKAVDMLWKMRDDADIGEDLRLCAWYWLELVDPDFKGRDFYDEEKAQIWACSKAYERSQILSDYIGKNDKQKITAKLSVSKDKGCPGRDSRMSFNDQREYRQRMEEKRERWATLEQSEFATHKNVNPVRGAHIGVSFSGKRDDIDPKKVSLTQGIRPIHNASRTETLVQ